MGLFADGTAVKRVGDETFALCKQYVDDIILVDTDQICAALKDAFEDTRAILEPSGALALAGLKAWAKREQVQDRTLVAVASGANMNFDRLRFVSERAEIGESREAVFAVTIPERRGSFLQFCQLVGRHSVTEFNYRIADSDKAHIYVGIQVSGREEAGRIANRLRTAGFECPERAGALLRFLEALPADWNISLFHYRNHGSDFGRALAGIQVPLEDRPRYEQVLAALGYPYRNESEHPAYRLFLTAENNLTETAGVSGQPFTQISSPE